MAVGLTLAQPTGVHTMRSEKLRTEPHAFHPDLQAARKQRASAPTFRAASQKSRTQLGTKFCHGSRLSELAIQAGQMWGPREGSRKTEPDLVAWVRLVRQLLPTWPVGPTGSGKSAALRALWQQLESLGRALADSGDSTRRQLGSGLAGAAALAAVALFGLGLGVGPAMGETLTIMLPASPVKEVTRVQRALVETWSIVREAFVDPTFNHQDWDDWLQEAVEDSLHAKSAEQAYDSIRTMLASLEDPYTRIVTPREYESFRINSDGSLEGVGLVLAAEPTTGQLVVVAPIEGGPADRAGIHAGDVLLQIDDLDITGMDPQEAAMLLRGRAGTPVVLTLQQTDDLASGGDVTTASALPSQSPPTPTTHVELQREAITFSPVYATLLPHRSEDGRVVRTGYIRLASFSAHAAEDMQRAIGELEARGASSFILDLRNNPGGLVRACLEVAQMWLDGADTLVNTTDRFGSVQTISTGESGEHALTRRPLAVLVNRGSASASEILAGALQDNGRATLVGETTYGKGKIQSVFELSDGTALFVTVAKYLSPAMHEIDKVGVAPDISCGIPQPQQQQQQQQQQLNEDLQPPIRSVSDPQGAGPTSWPSSSEPPRSAHIAPLESASEVRIAQIKADGPVAPGAGEEGSGETVLEISGGNTAAGLGAELQLDLCVLTAERQLDASASI